MTTWPVMSITDDQIAEIEALACRATPGPWTLTLDGDLSVASSEWGIFDIRQDQPNFVVDAHYAAAANPASVLALIARLREAEQDAARYRWLRERGDACQWMNIIRVDLEEFVMQDNALDTAIDEAMQEAKQ